jgi:hypothetical protein
LSFYSLQTLPGICVTHHYLQATPPAYQPQYWKTIYSVPVVGWRLTVWSSQPPLSGYWWNSCNAPCALMA